jgi:preprotein translocase subunit YajC
MTHVLAVVHLLAATKTASKSNPLLTLLPLILIVVAGYFFFLKPQQKKAAAARANATTPYEVGDEVQTIGGVVGTILEIHGERYTLLTGHTEADGNLDGAQPTRIVFVRQAIARKVDRIVDADVADDGPDDASTNGPPSRNRDRSRPRDRGQGQGRAPESFDIDKQGDEGAGVEDP